MPPLTDDVRARVADLLRQGLSHRTIRERLHVSTAYVSKVRQSLGLADLPAEADPVAAEHERTTEEARRREHIDAVRELSFRRFLERLVSEHVPPLPRVAAPKPRPAAKAAHARSPLLCLTDWHFEERVSAEGVMGLNAYDIPTACRRVYRVVHALRDWHADFTASGRFKTDGLTVACLGDFLTGTLHGLERHSDAPNIVRAALACGDLLALALRDLAATFGTVRVVGVVGNHGRLPDDRKVPTKDPTRSWDYLAYEIARRRLADCPGVEWHLPEAYGVLFDVGGQSCYACHGNYIPNNLGVVGYGVRRFASNLGSNLSAAGRPLRYCFFGHWHQSSSAEFAGMETFICPSLIGTQEYSFLSGGAVNRPAQELFLFSREHGLTGRERLYGEGGGYEGTYEVTV